MTDADLTAAIPAAAAIVLRDRDGATPELLMVERSPALAFAPGALVFPGGRLEAGDADVPGIDRWRVAAIRETLEETGVAVGLQVAATALSALRAALQAGVPAAPAFARAGAVSDPAALVPFAHWCPAHALPRRFDTRFFLCRAPEPALASVDGTENTRLLWTSAADALTAVADGRARAVFPTRRLLERLARFATFDAAVADARARPEAVVRPWIEHRDGAPWLRIPDGLGYPVTAEPLAIAGRG